MSCSWFTHQPETPDLSWSLNQIDKSLCGPRATAARAETGGGSGGGVQLGNNTRYARRYPGRLAYTKEEQGLRAV